MASKGVMEKPIFGWGQGNFYQVFDKYYDPRMYDQEPWFDRAHNIIFDWLVAGGILGFGAYLSVWFFVLWYLWRAPESSLSRIDKSVFTGLLVAYAFHNFFVFDNVVSYLLFFALLAFIHARVHAEKGTVIGGKTEINPQIGLGIGAPVVIIVMVTVLWTVNIRPLTVNELLIEGMTHSQLGNHGQALATYREALSYKTFGKFETRVRLTDATRRALRAETASDELKQTFFEFTVAEFEKQITETPRDAIVRVQYGQFLRSVGQYNAARAQFEVARELSPTKQDLYFLLGDIMIQQESFDEAFETFETAFRLAPENYEAGLLYALGALYVDDGVAFEEARASVSDSQFILSDNIAQAYLSLERFAELADFYRERIEYYVDQLNAGHLSDTSNLLKAHTDLMTVLLKLGRTGEAVSVVEQARALEPAFEEEGKQLIQQIRTGNFKLGI